MSLLIPYYFYLLPAWACFQSLPFLPYICWSFWSLRDSFLFQSQCSICNLLLSINYLSASLLDIFLISSCIFVKWHQMLLLFLAMFLIKLTLCIEDYCFKFSKLYKFVSQFFVIYKMFYLSRQRLVYCNFLLIFVLGWCCVIFWSNN